jgi:hypothetical protein
MTPRGEHFDGLSVAALSAVNGLLVYTAGQGAWFAEFFDQQCPESDE